MVRVKIGNVDLLGSFDTGQYGLLQLDDRAAKELKNSSLVVSAGNDGYDDPIVNVNDIVLDGSFTVNVKGIYPFTFEQTAPFRKGMQINEASYICFGYRFFSSNTKRFGIMRKRKCMFLKNDNLLLTGYNIFWKKLDFNPG